MSWTPQKGAGHRMGPHRVCDLCAHSGTVQPVSRKYRGINTPCSSSSCQAQNDSPQLPRAHASTCTPAPPELGGSPSSEGISQLGSRNGTPNRRSVACGEDPQGPSCAIILWLLRMLLSEALHTQCLSGTFLLSSHHITCPGTEGRL